MKESQKQLTKGDIKRCTDWKSTYLIQLYEERKITAKEAAEECGISEEEFLQKAEEYEKKAQK